MQNRKMAEEALQLDVKRIETKSKGEKGKIYHFNAEFQKISMRDKKAFLSDQCKEIEENKRIGKEYVKAVYCHPANLTYMQSTS